MRAWIRWAEIRTRRVGSVMEITLSAEFEARAYGTDVNMRSGGFSGYGLAEGEVGDVLVRQVLQQPAAFGLIRVDGHVDASAVVKAHRAVHGSLAHGADRQGLAKLLDEIQFHARENNGRSPLG